MYTVARGRRLEGSSSGTRKTPTEVGAFPERLLTLRVGAVAGGMQDTFATNYILQGMASVRNLLVGSPVLLLEAHPDRGRVLVDHLAGARLVTVRPRLVDRVDGERAHCCFVGGVPNCVCVHSGGDGNRTRVRKAPMYGFSLRLNLFTP